MTSPISTMAFHTDAANQMDALETALSQTQQQLSSGLKLQNAADDPVGMSQVNQLNMQLSASQQYVTNSDTANSNLQLEAQSLTDATNLLQSASGLAIQANNSSLNSSQLQDIATQLQQQLQQLVGIANSTNSNGDYLFAGTASTTVPFSQTGLAVSYNGSQQASQVQISSNQRISGSDAGSNVFMNLPAGNGTFVTAAGGANTGTAWIDPGTVTNASQWSAAAQNGPYTISFSASTDPNAPAGSMVYSVTDTNGNPVTDSSGNPLTDIAFTSPGVIAFNGVQTTVTGSPAAGDTFTVQPAGTSSAFSSLSSLITALQNPNLTHGQLTTILGTVQSQISGAMSSLDGVQASVGARINAIGSAQTAAQSAQTSLQTNISSLQDVDYAQATTQLSTEELALQAAQESYASISKLSLFNYLQG